MILSNETIAAMNIIENPQPTGRQSGMSYGPSVCGYDIRVEMEEPPFGYERARTNGGQGVWLHPGQGILLGTRERLNVPPLVVGFVKDKSTWARQGLCNAQGVAEPGWRGHLSVFVRNHGSEQLPIMDGDPIAQVIFQWLDKLPNLGYSGKYQDQGPGPRPAKFE